MDEELTTLGFLENVNATVTRINADLLYAIKNNESLTRKECSASLVELENTSCDLRYFSRATRIATFKIEDYLRPLLQDLLKVLRINLIQALENASNLDDLLNARIKKLSSLFRGKFGKDVQVLNSGFKFVAKDFDVKDQGQIEMDLQSLEGDPAL